VTEDLTTPQAGPSACPFIAFEDDRDHRSEAPDFRHRCFASPEPEPRAFPHQERYCLNPAFTGCPIFLDWAREEAAGVAVPVGRRSTVAGANGRGEDEATPAFLGGRGGRDDLDAAERRAAEASAGLWDTEGTGKPSKGPSAPPPPNSMGAPVVAQARRGPKHPGWENPPRLENFPRLRSRDERHTNQPLLFAALAIAFVMVALVLYPIVSVPGQSSASSSPSVSADASASAGASGSEAVITANPDSSSICSTYVMVQSGQTMASIAYTYHLQLWELVLANQDLVPNPNFLMAGIYLCIPPAGVLTQPPSQP
jgi:hypothetical protein